MLSPGFQINGELSVTFLDECTSLSLNSIKNIAEDLTGGLLISSLCYID